MKVSFKSLALLVATGATVALTGCTIIPTPAENKARFGTGDITMYAEVMATGKAPGCDGYVPTGKFLDLLTSNYLAEIEANCKNKDQLKIIVGFWRQVPGFHPAKVIIFVEKDIDVAKGDIIEYQKHLDENGRVTRPSTLVRIARKAKDVGKESGCYWSGGRDWYSQFMSGGIICDGWNWREQKFAQ